MVHEVEEWISEEEKKLVKELKDRVLEKLHEEYFTSGEDEQTAFLLRWIRARNWVVENAEGMLLTALEWRKENNIDSALTTKVDPYLAKTYNWEFVGEDYEGHPVLIIPFYEWDFRKVINNNKQEEFEPFMRHFLESFLKEIEKANQKRKPGTPPVTQFIVVCDTKGYPYGQMLNFNAMKKWFHMASTYEAYYPEIVFKICFINCPSFFQLFINMFKPFLAPRTMSKMTCYPNFSDWEKEAETLMDRSILTKQYGGTKDA